MDILEIIKERKSIRCYKPDLPPRKLILECLEAAILDTIQTKRYVEKEDRRFSPTQLGRLVTDLLYLPMGWVIVLFFRRMVEATSVQFAVWVVIGGLCYTLGFIFFAWRKLPFSHVVWHLFVIAGGVSFFLAFLLHLV